MKRRRMSAECEMDHSYAMPNIVSDLFFENRRDCVTILCVFFILFVFLFVSKHIERQLKRPFEKNPKRLRQQAVERHYPRSGWYIVSSSPLHVVHIQ